MTVRGDDGPVGRSMGVSPMSPTAVPAVADRGETPLILTGRMPVLLMAGTAMLRKRLEQFAYKLADLRHQQFPRLGLVVGDSADDG